MSIITDKLKANAHALRMETYALYLAYQDPRVPWYAKLLTALVIGYAFSPIDLIPDFIPVLGYLDDLILVPAGIAIALRMIPKQVMEEARERSKTLMNQGQPVNRTAAFIIISMWLLLLIMSIWLIVKIFTAI